LEVNVRNLLLPAPEKFNEMTTGTEKPVAYRLAAVFERALNLMETALELFIVTTVRCYEDVILSEDENYRKKVKQINKILKENFTAPSLGILLDLTRHCVHLIGDKDGKAPEKLLEMKNCLIRPLPLEVLAQFLNDLGNVMEIIRPLDEKKAKTVYKEQNKHQMLDTIFPIFVEHRNNAKHLREFSLLIEEHLDKLNLSIETWLSALGKLESEFNPILSNTFLHRIIERVDVWENGYIENGKQNFCFIVKTNKYENGKVIESEDKLPFEEFEGSEEYQRKHISQLVLKKQEEGVLIDLFPFFIIRNHSLYYYKRTKARGYEYYSPFSEKIQQVHVVQTKRKFSHSLFRIGSKGDRQALFWTEVLPRYNAENKVKANIPVEGISGFVGRKRQLKIVREDIIEIPNENGIIYGPGGVGKTALIVELSRQLFEEKQQERIDFDNIIWVSAKKNYYNPLLDSIQEREKQFDSLEKVLSAILRFFDYEEDIEEYGADDRKELVLELLEENRVLLVLDNFETIPKLEAEKIITFFGVDVKKRLRSKPNYFKIILTSREQVPSGFHQVKLEGLDPRESQELMRALFKPYKGSKPEISQEQKVKLHEITLGIPIIIIHCFGQIYEYNRSLDEVIRGLCVPSNKLAQFSYSEIISLLKRDECQLKVIILLELMDYPLSIRQISDILEKDEGEISSKIPTLINFQILDRIPIGIDEKYSINDTVNLFTKVLVQENKTLAESLKKKIAQNFTLEKKMDYTAEEKTILGIFNDFVSKSNYIDAERFIEEQLKKKPGSVLLKFHCAKYLKEQKRELRRAIDLLNGIIVTGGKHPNILRLLVSCYTGFDPPMYNEAVVYVKELEQSIDIEDEVWFEIAEFYIGWSTSLRRRGKLLDPIAEIKRQVEYKELARSGINAANRVAVPNRTHKYYYLCAQGHFNIWDNGNALTLIDKAMGLIGMDPILYPNYARLKRSIQGMIKLGLKKAVF
jgi:hypothetical protein